MYSNYMILVFKGQKSECVLPRNSRQPTTHLRAVLSSREEHTPPPLTLTQATKDIHNNFTKHVLEPKAIRGPSIA